MNSQANMSYCCDLDEHADDSFVDFEFDDTPDDESLKSQEGNDIDALNEETFGLQIDSEAVADLEHFADETARFKLYANDLDYDKPCSSTSMLNHRKDEATLHHGLNRITPKSQTDSPLISQPKDDASYQFMKSLLEGTHRNSLPSGPSHQKLRQMRPPQQGCFYQQNSNHAKMTNFDPIRPPMGFPFQFHPPNQNLHHLPPARFTSLNERPFGQQMKGPIPPGPFPMQFMQMMSRSRMPNAGPYRMPNAGPCYTQGPPRWMPPADLMKSNAYPRLTTGAIYPNGSNEHERPNRSHRRRAGLPSEKTISDVAFNPLGGFMSKKESAWLINLQARQCAVHGNQYEDDFYYVMLKKKHEEHSDSSNIAKSNDKSKNGHHASVTPHHYQPPKFVGSLGKPSLSTAKNPRQLIDLDTDVADDDEKTLVKAIPQTQRKLRTLFLLIENVFLQMLLCNDCLSKLRTQNLQEDERESLENEVKERKNVIIESPCFTDRLAVTLLIPKGKQMFLRALELFTGAERVPLLCRFIAGITTFMKKSSSDDLGDPSFVKTLLGVFRSLSIDDLISVVEFISIDFYNDYVAKRKHQLTLPTCENFQLAFNIIVSLLTCFARHNYKLAGSSNELLPFFTWLACTDLSLSLASSNLVNNLSEDVTVDEYREVYRWLMDQFLKFPGCIGLEIACELVSLTKSIHF